MPKNWLCIRYGGDEFLVVGNSKNYNGEDYCTQIKVRLEAKTSVMHLPYKLSASVGTYSVPANSDLTLEQAVEKVQDGMTIMFGGFLGVGSATQIIDAIVEKGVKDLTIIANDTAYDEVAHGKLVTNHQVKKAIVSHTGTNKQTALQKNEGTLIVEYVPQGTLAERIRAAGAGLGGVLTPTGMGTIMADGKEVITVDGKDYLLEKPLKADIAFLRANIVDEFGNMVFLGTTNNFNPLMATAADYVVVEAEKLVKVGEIKPECVHASGIYVDGIYVEK